VAEISPENSVQGSIPANEMHWTAPQIQSHTTNLDDLLWQSHKCASGGLCRREKFRNFLTLSEPELNTSVSAVSHVRTTYRKSFNATQYSTDGKHTLRMCAVWVSQPTIYQDPLMGNPQTRKHSGFHKFISSSNPVIEKFTEFNGTITFQITNKR